MAYIPLTLGSLTSDSVQAIATYFSQNANSIAASGSAFIEGLAAGKDFSFDVGDTDVLNYLNLTFPTDQLISPIKPVIDMNTISVKIEQLAALQAPTAPSLVTPLVTIPVLEENTPVLSMPTRPDQDVGPAPTDAPDIQDVQPPTAPAITFPNVPTFEELQLPSAPSFSLPSFTAESPQNTLSAPTTVFDYVDTGYLSELRDPLVAKLLDGLTNGGYGIEPGDEQALWARARDRAEQQGKIEVEQAGKEAVATSFPMPQGVYYQRLERARQAAQEKMSEINREIALKRADLYVENRRFTIQEVQKYEQMAISLYNAVQERALNFAKAAAEIGLAIYDAAIKKFNADMDAYKTEAQVFEIRIRAELAKAELFKAQIDAEKLRGEFNQIKVNLYNAQLQGITQTVNLYKSRVEAANLLAQLQQMKLEAFKSRVTIFSERVKAKQAEFDMYRAGIQGELAKIEVFKAQIEAYGKRVDAEETKARITLQGNEALLQQYKGAVQQYTSQMEGFTKTVDAQVESGRLQIQEYNVDVQAFQAAVQAVIQGSNVRVLNQKVNNEWNVAALNSRVEQAKFRLEQLKLTVENMNNINRFGAEYFRTSLGATLSGLNGLSVKTTTG